MKFLTAICVLFALLGVSLGFKNRICYQSHSADGDGIVGCYASIPQWTYNFLANECIFFIYGGCGGNENRFWSKWECELKCRI
ncbi:male accessory gland serine protease inhibitor-like [Scaptodrosophila lebanonensis]|uniref:Male accessory gland serine protease inhibitor-like n=1 Tax=Drosophila lebanonensis TaxID=7225 RepID=A0A6J2U7E0_DROLE|nr:male accessory gland serine protease inhibitor-like [Scaptodrosophila lebanonensis]